MGISPSSTDRQVHDVLPKSALSELGLFLSASLCAPSMIRGDGKSLPEVQLSHLRGEIKLHRDLGGFILPSPDEERQENSWEGLGQASPSQ